MSYNPVAGGLAHELAELLGSDPKSRMDHDLMEMKSFIEREGSRDDDVAMTFEEAETGRGPSELM